jgi:hypothetical protein
MLRYCDAIGECKSIPTLSLLPFPKLCVNCITWPFCFLIYASVLCPINLVYALASRIYGGPRLEAGREISAYIATPLLSVWNGEISACTLLRARYLTRLLLSYRAQFKINLLHGVYNRRLLDLLLADPPNKTAVDETEKFQKSFDLFQKITADSYQIGLLAIGGPFVALLTLALQKGFLPLLAVLWTYFATRLNLPATLFSTEQVGTLAGYFVIFGVLATWSLVSAWMDMRVLLVSLDVPEFERRACACAKIRAERQIPFDILFYLSLVSLIFWGYFSNFHLRFEQTMALPEAKREQYLAVLTTESIWVGFLFAIALSIGLIALGRRLLAKSSDGA